jgi:endo-1,4-beta-xylanase
MNRRHFLRTAASSTFLLSAAPWPARSAEPTRDEILAQARERIGKHRQGDGTILVRAADGRPVPGATVKVEQVRHEFLFGCNFFGFERVGDPESEQKYRERFAGLLNYATLPFYWAMYEAQRGQPNYDYSGRTADWCRDHHIACKGHPLVWDEPAGSPRWLPEDTSEIERLSHARVREIVTRFKGRIDRWDVVNEPTMPNRQHTRMGGWSVAKGAVPYVREHLLLAREANPQATLLVNDYSLDQPYYRILDALRDGGKLLFDAVGIQSHMHGGVWTQRRVGSVCDMYARLGLPLHFTELTIVSGPRQPGGGERWAETTPELEARQAEQVAQFYTTLFSHPAVEAVTWWDFSDRHAWQGAAAGLVRKDMSPKPAYEKLLGLIKDEWWTKTEGRTNDRGEFACRAFFGRHKVNVSAADGRSASAETDWKRGAPNQIELRLT